MGTVVNIRVAKRSLSQLVDRAAAGEEILIAKNGKPVARLTRLSRRSPKTLLGIFAGKIHIEDRFNALPAEFKRHV